MKLTFSDFETDGSLNLDCDTLAELTGSDTNELFGLFGGGIVGTVKVTPDEFASLADNLSDGAATGEAVGPAEQAGYRWSIPTSVDNSDPNVTKILEARQELQDKYEDTDNEGDYGFRVLARYAARLGYRYEIDQLQDYNDFASVWTITPVDREKNQTVKEYQEIFAGNVFNVDVELKSPIEGGEFSASLGSVVGETFALEQVADMASDVLSDIRKQVREVRA